MNEEEPCWGITCHGCGVRYSERSWLELHLSQRLEPNELRRLIINWSDDECIEVRRCDRCSRVLPARRQVPTAVPSDG